MHPPTDHASILIPFHRSIVWEQRLIGIVRVCVRLCMYAEKISMTLEEHQQRARFALITRSLCTCWPVGRSAASIHFYVLFSFPLHPLSVFHLPAHSTLLYSGTHSTSDRDVTRASEVKRISFLYQNAHTTPTLLPSLLPSTSSGNVYITASQH